MDDKKLDTIIYYLKEIVRDIGWAALFLGLIFLQGCFGCGHH